MDFNKILNSNSTLISGRDSTISLNKRSTKSALLLETKKKQLIVHMYHKYIHDSLKKYTPLFLLQQEIQKVFVVEFLTF